MVYCGGKSGKSGESSLLIGTEGCSDEGSLGPRRWKQASHMDGIIHNVYKRVYTDDGWDVLDYRKHFYNRSGFCVSVFCESI